MWEFVGARRLLLAVTCCGALAAASGCGSDSDSEPAAATGSSPAANTSGSPDTAAAAPAGDEVTGDPIVIGTICSCSGAVSSSSASSPLALNAWVKWTNTHGGINGHPVKIVQLDDGLDAARTVKQLKELVEQEKVVAIVGEMSNLDPLWAEYINEKQLPVIGAAMFNATFESNPLYFPTGSQNLTSIYGNVAEAKRLGKSKMAVMYCAEAPSCAGQAPQYPGVAKIIGGVEIVKTIRITGDAPNYTAACLTAKQAGADVMAILHAPAIVTRVATDCAKQGFTPQQVNLSYTPGVDWAENPALQNLITLTPNAPLWDDSTEAAKTFHTAMDQYGEGIKDTAEYNPANMSVWVSGEAFKLAGDRAKLTPESTSADVLRGLYTFNGETLGGLAPPMTFTEGMESPPILPCWYVSQITDNKWTAPQGAKASCVPEKDIAAVEALRRTKA